MSRILTITIGSILAYRSVVVLSVSCFFLFGLTHSDDRVVLSKKSESGDSGFLALSDLIITLTSVESDRPLSLIGFGTISNPR